jgi:Xaa-Pro aminopeptidase
MTPVAAPAPITEAEFRERQRTFAERLAARGLDAALIWSSCGSALDSFGHVFYLTNHYSPVPRVNVDIAPFMTGWGQTAAIVTADGETVLVVESGDYRRDLVVADRVRFSRDLYAEVAAALQELGLERAALGLAGVSCLPLSAWRIVSERVAGARLEDVDEEIYRLRALKSPAEIDLMRHASAVGCELQNAMLPLAEAGRTDADLALAGHQACIEHGAVPWDFAFASGPNSTHGYWSRMPAWDRSRRYVEGDLVHPDAYGCVDGYFYDVQRTVVVGGDPGPRMRWLLDGVVGVVEALCAACRPGASAASVARLRWEWLRDYGYVEPGAADSDKVASGEIIEELAAAGHGLGLGFELPWIDESSTWLLEPSMTIALEVYMTEPGEGTAVIEHVVLVTDDEPEVLTEGCPARWW